MYTGRRRVRAALAAYALVMFAMCGSLQAGAIARATARLPEVPAPPQARAQWISQSMRMNGLPMTLQSFSSSLPVEAVLAHYAGWWSTADSGTRGVSRLVRRGEWQILALTSPDLHITVRAKSVGGGAEGDVAVSRNPAHIKRSTATSFPHPRGAHVVNLQEFEDPNANAEHISLISARPAAIEAQDFAELLTRKGWTVYRDQRVQSSSRGHVLEAQKGSSLAQLTFQPGAHVGSYIIVIWRKA